MLGQLTQVDIRKVLTAENLRQLFYHLWQQTFHLGYMAKPSRLFFQYIQDLLGNRATEKVQEVLQQCLVHDI